MKPMKASCFEFYCLPPLPSKKGNSAKLKSLELCLPSSPTAGSAGASCSSAKGTVSWLLGAVGCCWVRDVTEEPPGPCEAAVLVPSSLLRPLWGNPEALRNDEEHVGLSKAVLMQQGSGAGLPASPRETVVSV